MSIEDRMTADERQQYESLRASGYAALRQAHEIFMEVAMRAKDDKPREEEG